MGYGADSWIETNLHFYPGMSNLESLNSMKKDDILCSLDLRTHGILVCVGDEWFDIKNFQIVAIDTMDYDEYVKFKKSLADYMAMGAYFAGVIGSVIGAVASIGHKTVRLKGTYLRITYWDIDKKELKYIVFDYTADKKDIEKFINDWKEQERINIDTGRKPGEGKAPGCMSIVVGSIIISLLMKLMIL